MAGSGTISADLDCFTDILYMSSLRGPHSTGLLTVDSSSKHMANNPRVEKIVGPSPFFIMTDEGKKNRQLRSYQADVFMGHCRYATVGGVNIDNTHPFDTGRFVSSHNGTLYDSWSYDHKKSDSQLMFEKMESEGVVKVLTELKTNSAYAISMWDKTNKRLILARNSHRPLYVGINQSRNVLYWASEYGFLYTAANRNNIDMKIYPLTAGMIYWLDPKKVTKGKKDPWGTTKINPKPAETPGVSKRVKPGSSSSQSDFNMDDWEAWNTWNAQYDAEDTSPSPAQESAQVFDFTKDTLLSITTLGNDYSSSGGPPWDDYDDGINYVAANGQLPGKNFPTNADLDNIDRRSKSSKGPKAMKAAAKRASALSELLGGESFVDSLFDDLQVQKFEEDRERLKAEKAIEEAQGITSSHPKFNGDEECCVCGKHFERESDFMEADFAKIDGAWYFVCAPCETDIKKAREENGKRVA